MKVTVEQFLNAGLWFVGGDVVDAGCGNHEVFNGDVWNKPSHKDRSSFVVSLTPRPNLGTQPVDNNCMVEVTQRNGAIFTRKAIDVNWLNVKAFPSWKPSLKYLEQQMNDKQESAMNISERDIENAFIKQDDVDVERVLAENDEWVNGLPPVGYEFHIDEGEKYDSHTWLFEEKTGWEHEDLIRVVYSDPDLEFVVCLNIQHDVLTTAKLKYDFFLTPEQLAAKEREDAINAMPESESPEDVFWKLDAIKNSDEHRLVVKGLIASLIYDVKASIHDAGYRK